MEINKDALDHFLALDDEVLREQVQKIAQAAGMDQKKAQRATGDMKRIRRRLDQMNENDIQKAVEMLGEENVALIRDAINGGSKQNKQ